MQPTNISGEIRIPTKLLVEALSSKCVNPLRILCIAKLIYNGRVRLSQLIEELDLLPRTGKRILTSIISLGWAGSDGIWLFVRSWNRLKKSKRGGLYLSNTDILSNPKKFEALIFSWSLKRLYRRRNGLRPNNRRALPRDLSLRSIALALGLKERRCKTLRSSAQRYGFIAITRQYAVLGRLHDLSALRKNLHEVPVFNRDKLCVSPTVSQIHFNI